MALDKGIDRGGTLGAEAEGTVSAAMNGNAKVRMLDKKEAAKLFDVQARRLLGMSGKEFQQRWNAKSLGDMDSSAVTRMVLLLPLADD